MQLITLMLRLPWITFRSKCCSTFLKTNSFRWVFLDGQFRLYLFEKAPFLGQGELHSEDTLREQRFSFPHFHIFMKCHIQTFHLSWGLFNCVEWIAYMQTVVCDESDRRRRENLPLVTTAQPGAASKTGYPHGWLQQPLTIFRNMIKVSLYIFRIVIFCVTYFITCVFVGQ